MKQQKIGAKEPDIITVHSNLSEFTKNTKALVLKTMTHTDPQKTYKEFQERLNTMSDEELIDAFNREVGNPGWTSSRAVYLVALHEEFEKRHYDYSIIKDNGDSHDISENPESS